MPTALLGMNTEELRSLAREEGQPAYRGTQLAEWLYRFRARTPEEMTSLPAAFRRRLSERYVTGRPTVVVSRWGDDRTVKLLLEEADGARVETVGLPYFDRTSCCVSSQVGCSIGCIFCATGLSGFTRNLTAGEIVGQVIEVQEAILSQPPVGSDDNRRVDHVTFMGMGEPLLNYDETLKALRLLNEEMGIAMRHLAVSTVGFIPGIRRLAEENLQLTLAVSLHAPTDDLRRRLIPGMTRWTVAEIIDACRDYVRRTGRRITFEYCLLDGINDGRAEAEALTRVLRGLNCHVNLIKFNLVTGLEFRASHRDSTRTFRELLDGAGIPVTLRVQRGADIDAACGQLRWRTIQSV